MSYSNKQKCIIQVLPALDSGGVERGTLETAEALVQEGWRSIVISAGGRLEQRLIRQGSFHIKLPVNTKNPFKWIKLNSELKNIFLKEKPDIIHIRSRVPAWTAGKVAKKLNIPIVSTVHGRFISNNFFKRLYNRPLLNAEVVIAISNYVRKNILISEPWSENLIKVIHRGADVETFNPKKISENRIIQMANKLQLPDDAQIIMMPARPTKWKGHSVLIEAFGKIKNDKVFCVMPGASDKSSYAVYLKKIAKKHDVLGKILFLPFLDDLPAAYMLADVVVIASLKPEPFGRVAVEAQSMGRPVVAFDHGGVAESILNRETGFLIQPGDVKALVTAILELLQRPLSLREKMAKKARKHVVNNFSRGKMTKETIKLYDLTLDNFKNKA